MTNSDALMNNAKIPVEIIKNLSDLTDSQKFTLIYELATGLYQVDELKGYHKELAEYIKDELSNFTTCCKKFDDFENLLHEVNNFKFQGDNKFTPEKLSSKLLYSFEDYSKAISKCLFNYGLQVGRADLKLDNYNPHEIFDIYYNLTFGFYDLTKANKQIKNSSKYIKNEVFEKEGKFFKPIDKIFGILHEIENMECKYRKS